MLSRFDEKFSHLPKEIYNERLFQAMTQILFFTLSGDAYGFYETSEQEGRPLNESDEVGAITIRIDYDPNFDPQYELDMPREIYDSPEVIFDEALMMLEHPNSQDHNPDQARIDHVRLSIRLSDTIMSKTFWSTHFDLIRDL